MSDNQAENEFEASQRAYIQSQNSKKQLGMLCLFCPCTLPFGICFAIYIGATEKPLMGNPPDATKLSEDEAKPYMDGLQGLWEVIPTEIPEKGFSEGAVMVNYNRAHVSGNVATLSGMQGQNRGPADGAPPAVQSQVLSIHKTPRGTIYMDDKGNRLIEFSPEKGIIRFRNALGYGIMWKKEVVVVTNQP